MAVLPSPSHRNAAFCVKDPRYDTLLRLTPMVLHNPNNWHWVNKDASEWAREYLDEKLVGIEASDGESEVRVMKIESMDGDVDVSQRKGKVITLFDVKLQLEYEGKTAKDDAITGSLTIPEVAHDTEENEYVFTIEIHSETASKEAIKPLIRNQLIPQLRKALQTLAPALIAHHGKDLQHAPGSNPSSGFSTPRTLVTSSSAAQTNAKAGTTASTASDPSGAAAAVNTTTVTLTTEFRTSAAELFTTLTDPARVAAFTRGAPKVWEGAHPGGQFAIFDGNVTGRFTSLAEPTQIVQAWRLKQWPEGHYSRLEINLDQNDADGVTNMRVVWEGVPVGQEEVTRRNWGEYFERGIKFTFGFGTIL